MLQSFHHDGLKNMRNTIFISRISSNWLRKWSFRADRCWQKFIFSILSINKLIPWTASFHNNRRNWKCIRVISNRWISISHSQWQVSSTAKKTIVAAMKNSSEVNCFSFSTVEHFSKKRPPPSPNGLIRFSDIVRVHMNSLRLHG